MTNIESTSKRSRGRPPKPPVAAKPPAPGIIEVGKAYPLALFKQITGLGPQGLRDAQDEGFRVVYVGKNAYVVGDDWLTFLMSSDRRTQRWESKPGTKHPKARAGNMLSTSPA